MSAAAMRDDALTVSGGTGDGRRAGGRPGRTGGASTVTPSGAGRDRDLAGAGAGLRRGGGGVHGGRPVADRRAGGPGGRAAGRAADGELRGHAGGARRRGRAPLPGGVQRGHRHQLPVAARGRVRGERRAGHGRTARGRPARPVQGDGAARLGRGRDDHAAGGARLRGLGCDLHEGGRPASVDQQPVGDGDGPGGHRGGRRAGRGRRRRGAGVRGDAEPGGGRDGGGGLCDGGRQRARGRGLPGGERDAGVPGRRVVEDGRGGGVRRLARRGRGDADAAAVERLVGAGDGRRRRRGRSRTRTRCRGRCWRGSAGRRRCRWSSRWRRGWRRLASPGSGAGWRAASCGGAWSGTSRSA